MSGFRDQNSDESLRRILTEVRSIAVVGLSADATRPSSVVTAFLRDRGYKMVGVNPQLAGKQVLGVPVYRRLADIPHPVDMVDIFRNSAAVPPVVDAALALSPKPKVIWMQLDVSDPESAHRAEMQGVKVVMNRCPKIEYPRLIWAAF